MNLETVDHLLTTTRSVRKRLDFSRPVEPEIIERCLEIALQAPSSSNSQRWQFIVITDPEKRAKIAELYRTSYLSNIGPPNTNSPVEPAAGGPSAAQIQRVRASSFYLAEHMHEVPVLILGCIQGRPDDPRPVRQASLYGSILPAAWSLMLALRARGLGSAWTTLHLHYEQEIADLLGIPADVSQAVLLPVAYFTGDDFKPARRVPATERTHWDGWGERR